MIDCMAIGGLFAYMHFKKMKIINVLYNPVLNWAIVIFSIIVLFIDFTIPYLHYEFFAILYGILILNFSTNPKPIINLENRALDFLGKISYGLYMYHVICIVISLKLLNIFNIHNWLLQLIVSLGITIIISSLSYYGFEQRFIKMKKKFSKIISGDNARTDK